MLLKKVTAAIVILAFALVCAGCAGGDDDGKKGRRASRSFGKKKDKAMAEKKEKEVEAYTPEGSMKRDLTRMQQREKQQAQLVAQLRGGRNPDQARIQREEDKLYELRGRVQEYDAALQRYEMASSSRPRRDVVGEPLFVPDEVFRDRPVRNQTAYGDDYRGYARNNHPARSYAGLEGYRSDPVVYQDERVTHARLPLTYERDGQGDAGPAAYQGGYREEREQVVYNPLAERAGAYDERQTLTAPGSLPPARQSQAYMPERSTPNQNQFAGAPVGRPRYPAPQQRETNAVPPWESGPMYSDKALAPSNRPLVPDVYANRRQKEETLWPAGTAMVAPAEPAAAPKQLKTTTVRLPENDLKPLPAADKSASGKVPAPQAAAASDDMDDDEAFSPDMFLGR